MKIFIIHKSENEEIANNFSKILNKTTSSDCLVLKNAPLILYDREWEVMSDKLNNKKYVSFTESEKRIPKIFCMIYIFAFILSIIIRIF